MLEKSFSHGLFRETAQSHSPLTNKKSLNVLVPGCGSFPSAKKFLDELIATFPQVNKFNLLVSDPGLDKKDIETIQTSIKNFGSKINLEITTGDIKSVYSIKKHQQEKADLIYLEHPQLDLPSQWLMSDFYYREQIPYLNPLMTEKCIIVTCCRNSLEMSITLNLFAHCFTLNSTQTRIHHKGWALGNYLGVLSEMSWSVVVAEPQNIPPDLLSAQIKTSDFYFSCLAAITLLLSMFTTSTLLENNAYHYNSVANFILPLPMIFFFALALKSHDVKNYSKAPFLFFCGVVASHACMLNYSALFSQEPEASSTSSIPNAN